MRRQDGSGNVLGGLFRRIRAGRCVLFLGSGASKEAGAPTGPELATELALKFLGGRHQEEPLSKVAAYIEHMPGVGRRELVKYLIRRLSTLHTTDSHVLLTRFPWAAVFTTNYDRLIEDAYDASSQQRRIIPVLTSADLSFQNELQSEEGTSLSGVVLCKLHGCVSSPTRKDAPLVISEDDLADTAVNRRALLRLLEVCKYTCTFLFVGYSFGDPKLGQIWHEVRAELGNLLQWAYAVYPQPSEEARALWRDRYVELIDCTFSQFAELLRELDERGPPPGEPVGEVTRARVVASLMAALDLRIPGHTQDTEIAASLAHRVGARLGVSGDDLSDLLDSTRLANLGKLAMPDSILYKPGKLSEMEWLLLKQQVTIASRLLSAFPDLQRVARIVGCSHEHYDGSGYPDGLAAHEIPLAARILSAVQVFCALTTKRPYRAAYSPREAVKTMRSMAGTVLDPTVVDVLGIDIETLQVE